MTMIDAFVGDLDRVLRGSRRAKGDLLAEARDHLVDATEALQARGHEAATAQALAIEQFGAVREIAPGYQTILSVSLGRRTSLGLLAALIAQPAAWALWEGVLGHTDDPTTLVAALNGVIEVTGMVAMLAALAGALLCGIGARRFGVRAAVVRGAGLAAIVASGSIILLGLGMFWAGSDHSWHGLGYFAVVALLPMVLVFAAAISCLRSLRSASAEVAATPGHA